MIKNTLSFFGLEYIFWPVIWKQKRTFQTWSLDIHFHNILFEIIHISLLTSCSILQCVRVIWIGHMEMLGLETVLKNPENLFPKLRRNRVYMIFKKSLTSFWFCHNCQTKFKVFYRSDIGRDSLSVRLHYVNLTK